MKRTNSSIVIIGSGIAGLYAAIKLAENDNKNIILVTKSNLRESNSRYAQGGIVGVLPENIFDSIDLHVKDTLSAGAGLTDPAVARFISQNSAEAIKDLIKYGVDFDKDEGDQISLTLEAAHSVRRILHAGGDSTGRSIELALSNLVEEDKNIKIYRKTQAIELLIDKNNECKGVIVLNTETGEYETISASAVIIATGGIGQVYSNTTNPKIATGDGIALAYRANAVMQDMEFIQFHPTALNINENDTRFLISESVRGEGARLKNLKGEYFGSKYDSRGDLAPRDVVTRSIFFEMQNTNTPHVCLDTSTIDQNRLKERFPNIIRVCKENGIDMLQDTIPVSPAAHYFMGGIKISVNGKTSVNGLYAIGEASCSSLHGANRLASNSLLECVVIARKLAYHLNNMDLSSDIGFDNMIDNTIEMYTKDISGSTHNIAELTHLLKTTMWENVGIVRNEKTLSKALETINNIKLEFNQGYKYNSLEEYEFRNLLTISDLITKSAIARKESRGAHYREDYPEMATSSYHSYTQQKDTINALPLTEIHN